jgi:hypothetical protein
MCDTHLGQNMCETHLGQIMCDTHLGQNMCDTHLGQKTCTVCTDIKIGKGNKNLAVLQDIGGQARGEQTRTVNRFNSTKAAGDIRAYFLPETWKFCKMLGDGHEGRGKGLVVKLT